MSSILRARLQEHADRLTADPFFTTNGITVLTEDMKDIEYTVNAAVAKIGVCVIVAIPNAVSPIGSSMMVHLEETQIVGRILENVTINRSKETHAVGLEIAEVVASLWQGFQPFGGAENTTLDQNAIQMAFDPVCLAYDVSAITQTSWSYTVEKLADPSIDIAGGTCTITHPTGGAGIFYTINGPSVPIPRLHSVYTSPFAVNGGDVVRAKAWLAGYNASDVTQSTA